MGPYSGVLMVSIALLQCFSIQVVITKISDLNHNKDDPQYTSTLQYLTNLVCEATLQCTGGHSSKSSSGCHLADGDTGDLYKKALKHLLNRNMIIDHDVDELITVDVSALGEKNSKSFLKDSTLKTKDKARKVGDVDELITVDDLGQEENNVEAFVMVSDCQLWGEARDVYKVSMKSGVKAKTGISLTNIVYSLVYDRLSNTLFWSQKSGIFGQVIGFNSKQIQISFHRNAQQLNVYNNTLFYMIVKSSTSIYTRSLTEGNLTSNIWICKKYYIAYLTVNAEVLCGVKTGDIESISCFDIASKKEIYTRFGPMNRRFKDLTLLKSPKSDTLVFVEYVIGMYHIKALEIAAGKRFWEPKEITLFKEDKRVYAANCFLIYTFFDSRKVEIWKVRKNGSLGAKAFTTFYPLKGAISLVAFL